MNNKKNYATGTRRDIIYLLHCNGILTYRSIRILPKSFGVHRTITQKLNEMLEEEVLGKVKSTSRIVQQNFFYMRDYESNSKTTSIGVPKECIEYYRAYYKEIIRALWTSKSSIVTRKILESEINTFMFSAGIDAMPDQNNEDNAKYFGAREIKRYTGHKDDMDEKDGEKKVKFSKIFGLLLSKGGNYGIYHTYKSGLTKLSGGEQKILYQLNTITREIKGPSESIGSAIVVVKDLKSLEKNVDIENFESQEALNYYNFETVYDRIYAIPYNESGRDTLTLMTREGWKMKMIVAATGEYQDTRHMPHICDHYDNATDVSTLVFCSPDIVRLKKFIAKAKLENNKEKFRVICFDYQKEFVKAVVKQNALIYTTPFEEYYRKEMNA